MPAATEASSYFEEVNHGALNHRKVELHFGDGRNLLLLADQRWDVITCDPIHPLYGSASSDRRPFLEFLEPAAYAPGIWKENA